MSKNVLILTANLALVMGCDSPATDELDYIGPVSAVLPYDDDTPIAVPSYDASELIALQAKVAEIVDRGVGPVTLECENGTSAAEVPLDGSWGSVLRVSLDLARSAFYVETDGALLFAVDVTSGRPIERGVLARVDARNAEEWAELAGVVTAAVSAWASEGAACGPRGKSEQLLACGAIGLAYSWMGTFPALIGGGAALLCTYLVEKAHEGEGNGAVPDGHADDVQLSGAGEPQGMWCDEKCQKCLEAPTISNECLTLFSASGRQTYP